RPAAQAARAGAAAATRAHRRRHHPAARLPRARRELALELRGRIPRGAPRGGAGAAPRPCRKPPEGVGVSFMDAKLLDLLGADAASLLEHVCRTVPKSELHLPGPDFIDRVFVPSDRKPGVLANLQRMFDTGRLRGTGYLSILPVD